MEIKIQSNLKNIQARYAKFIHKLPRIVTQGLEQAGAFMAEAQRTRTSRGRDVDMKFFTPYSRAYSELKNKTKVDLQDTNRMLQSISWKRLNRNHVQVYFRSQDQLDKAFYHQTGVGKLPVRKFFGFNKDLERKVQKNFEKFISKTIKGMNI